MGGWEPFIQNEICMFLFRVNHRYFIIDGDFNNPRIELKSYSISGLDSPFLTFIFHFGKFLPAYYEPNKIQDFNRLSKSTMKYENYFPLYYL